MWEWDVDVTVADFGHDVSVNYVLSPEIRRGFPIIGGGALFLGLSLELSPWERSLCVSCVCLSVCLQVQLFSSLPNLSHRPGQGWCYPYFYIVCLFVCVCVSAPLQLLSRVRLSATTWTDCVPPVSSVHGIFQARILDWVAISYPRGSSQARDGSCNLGIFCVGGQILYHCATWEAHIPSLLAANVIAATESNYIPVVGRCSLVSKPFTLL